MSLSILGPYTNNLLPEYIQYQLREDSSARCAAFNRRGTFLAIGCTDGRVVVRDFQTNTISKILIGHVMPITSISWSRDGRKLLTSSLDYSINLWDLINASPDTSMLFESQVTQAMLHPRNSLLCIVSTWLSDPYVINLKTLEKKRLVSDITSVDQQPTPSADYSLGHSAKMLVHTTAVFNIKGDLIYSGNSRGTLSIFNGETLALRHQFQLESRASIKSIVFCKTRPRLLLNCSDKIIRVWDTDHQVQIFELTDAVNRLQWKSVCFTSDGEHILGGLGEKHEHKIYIWTNPEKGFGSIFRFIEGPKEGIMDILWHPTRPILVSISTTGLVYIWGSYVSEKWSSFVPNFSDLKQNEEYLEREDEFDEISNESQYEANQVDMAKDYHEEDELIDIITLDRIEGMDSEEEDTFYLPVIVIPDHCMQPDSSKVETTSENMANANRSGEDLVPITRCPNKSQSLRAKKSS